MKADPARLLLWSLATFHTAFFFAVFVASVQDEAWPLVLRNIRFGIIRDVNHLFRESGRHLR